MSQHILVVDDREENRYLLASPLQGHGFLVDTVEHGQQALTQARQRAPDLVISDLLMPVMDGYALLTAWKRDAALAPIPFLVCTATYTDPEDERLAMQLGADAFILKPFDPEQLIATVRTALQTPTARAGAPQPAAAPEADTTQARYRQALVRKLEQKTEQLEHTNAALERDIVRRRVTEEALRISEERFRLLTRATNDAIWDQDLQAGRSLWQSGFRELFGHDPDAVHGEAEGWTALIHPDDRDDAMRAFHALTGGAQDSWIGHYRVQRADGSWAEVEDRRHLIRNGDGKPQRLIGGIRDLTRERTLERQLRQAQRLEAIGQLTGGIAHDFNNLLTVVLGNAEELAERLVNDPEGHELATTILSAADRGAELTGRLLAFARSQPLSPSPVELQQLLDELAPFLRRALGPAISIELDVRPDLPPPVDRWSPAGARAPQPCGERKGRHAGRRTLVHPCIQRST